MRAHALHLLLFILALSLQLTSPASYAAIGHPGAMTATPTTIHSSIFITDIDDIDSAQQSFTANVYMEFRWHDPRLINIDTANSSSPTDQIWQPRIQIVNQQKVLGTFPEMPEVDLDGNVVYRQRLWGSFSQPLNLRNFPMDQQQLSIQVVAVGYNETEIIFVQNPDEPSGVAEQLSQTEWEVTDWTAKPFIFAPTQSAQPLSGFLETVNITRNTGYYFIKVIAPLLLIVAMSWSVFWTDSKEFGIRISIAITAMLTLIAYRFSIGEMVPKVSYLTRLDYFILGSTLSVFLVLVLVIVGSNMIRSERLDRIHRLDNGCRYAFPILLLFITAASFLVG